MEKIVLIGSNIAHSRSPRLHNHLFQRYNLPYQFELMSIEAGDVVAALERVKRGGYRGANVTSPHKFVVLPAVDEIDPEAELIGAVNTIVIEVGRALGYNTDADGFARSLRDEPLLAAPFSAAIIGTGGAAMAATAALLERGTLRTLALYSRTEAGAARAVERWDDPRVVGRALDAFEGADLVVHATPVGLAGGSDSVLAAERLAGTSLLYEMIYWPRITPLMEAAAEQGIRTIGGGAMFIHQALGAFELWTGIAPALEDVPPDLFD